MRSAATIIPPATDDRRKETRVPLAVSVRYGLEGWDGFVEQYGPNLSYNGLFLVTREQLPPGTEIAFELRLADDRVALSGRGLVRWVRGERPGVPPGLGLQFTHLDEENERRVREVVDRYLAAKLAGVTPPPLALDVLGLAASRSGLTEVHRHEVEATPGPLPVVALAAPQSVDPASVRNGRIITVLVGVIATLAAFAALLAAFGR